MKTTIYIEIPVKITFSVEPGQKRTYDEPGYDPQLEDIQYDEKQVIKEIYKAIYGKESTIDEELWEAVEKEKQVDEEYRADIIYQAWKDSGKKLPF